LDDRTTRLESAVGELRQTVAALERRLAALEAAGVGSTPEPGAESPAPAATPPVEAKSARDPIVILSLIGRLLLVLAGGFFLRAMTDTGTLAPPVGLALGFLYALVWLFMADRAAKRQQAQGALFHALGTAMIAFPLLVEAATKFKVLSGTGAVLGIAVLAGAMLAVAWRRQLRIVAWIAVVGALPTCFALLVQTGVVAPFAFLLIALGVVTLWMGYAYDWWGLRWPVALAADVAVVGVTLRVLSPEHQETPLVAMALQLLLLAAYVLSIAIRTIIRRRGVVLFEVVQTIAVLVIGFGGVLYLSRVTAIGPRTIGVIGLVLGAVCYGVAVRFLDGEEGASERNVYFYTSLGLAYVLGGLVLILGSPWVGVACGLLAVAAAALWSRLGRLFLLLNAVVYLLACGSASGVLLYCARAIAAPWTEPWALPGMGGIVLLVAGGLSAYLATAQRGRENDDIASGLRLLLDVIFALAAGGCAVGYLVPRVASLPDGGVNAGVLATVRTGVLSIATLAIAWAGRQPRWREWAWLVYPLLVGIGLKMVMQDFKESRPATLFIAMALYGAALIVAPRLRRAASATTTRAEPVA